MLQSMGPIGNIVMTVRTVVIVMKVFFFNFLMRFVEGCAENEFDSWNEGGKAEQG